MATRKLRKTLLRPKDELIQTLKKQIQSQSKETLLDWCLFYAKEIVIPLYEREVPGDRTPQEAYEAARSWQRGKMKLPAVRKRILACHEKARELEDDPIAQAAARAVAQASSTIHAPGHCLGFVFYAVAALSYDELGLDASEEDYDKEAKKHGQKMLMALEKIAVEDEKYPVKINWRL